MKLSKNDVLTTKTTCPKCSQNQRLTIDDLKPMVPYYTQKHGKDWMKCPVCNSIYPLPNKQ